MVPRLQLWAADLLTASRLLVAVVLLTTPTAAVVVLVVAWSWVSDVLDGRLARAAGGHGRLGPLDHVVDAVVGIALVWYLGVVGFVPAWPTRIAAVLLVAVWATTRVFAVQMLLLTVANGAVLWWAFARGAPGARSLAAVAVAIAVVERRRFVTRLVPAFLTGWRDLLTRTRRRPVA